MIHELSPSFRCFSIFLQHLHHLPSAASASFFSCIRTPTSTCHRELKHQTFFAIYSSQDKEIITFSRFPFTKVLCKLTSGDLTQFVGIGVPRKKPTVVLCSNHGTFMVHTRLYHMAYKPRFDYHRSTMIQPSLAWPRYKTYRGTNLVYWPIHLYHDTTMIVVPWSYHVIYCTMVSVS